MNLSNETVIHIQKDEIQYLQFKKLLEYSEIKYAYVLGLDKSFKIYDHPSENESIKNELSKKAYKEICKELNLKYQNLVNTMQNHTDNIKIIDKKVNATIPDFNIYQNTDGLITNKKEIILATINADCILLVFYDPVKKVIANVHSGWKGTLKRISVKTIEKMKSQFECNPKNIICCMSPSIRQDHFEVKEDVYKMYTEEFKELNDEKYCIYKKRENNKYLIDTIKINRLILKNEGLNENNIIDSGICSVCNKNLIHSYRGHGEEAGRATQIITMV